MRESARELTSAFKIINANYYNLMDLTFLKVSLDNYIN